MNGVIEVKQGTVTIGKGFDAYFNTIRRMPYLKEYDGPPIVELPEFPPEGQTVYIPHRKRDGSDVSQQLRGRPYDQTERKPRRIPPMWMQALLRSLEQETKENCMKPEFTY